MTRSPSPPELLSRRLSRPQRVGVFGHRGVGKTTLLTMLYREAVGGRLPGLRLAAADARTAAYLADKVLQLEAGKPLPATLGETELRFHLYQGESRVELVLLDYQGEHVALGRAEPVRDFLRECDAVWLCLDVESATSGPAAWEAEQEVEQLAEDYLAGHDPASPHRPMALLVTKADRLGPVDAHTLDWLVVERFGMTRHTLATHCPEHAFFLVSSLGPVNAPASSIQVGARAGSGPGSEAVDPPEGAVATLPPVTHLEPFGLGGPLAWLAGALRRQDEARLGRLWEEAPSDLPLLERAAAAFAARHPDSALVGPSRERLRRLRLRRRGRRALGALACAAALLAALWGYDALGAYRARQFEAAHPDDPAAARRAWERHAAWHPTRHWLSARAARAEQDRLARLDGESRARERAGRLDDLRRRAGDPDADPEALWVDLQRFHDDYPDHDQEADWTSLRDRARLQAETRRRARARAALAERDDQARQALRELDRAEASADLAALAARVDQLLRAHAGTAAEADLLRRRAGYLARLDERDFESARDYSARSPANFHTRTQRYQAYLDRHPRGAFAARAREEVARVAAEWDRHDFRLLRDQYRDNPGEVMQLAALCRTYLAVHPGGKYAGSAREVLRWTERVSSPGEYKLVLKSGSFERGTAFALSRGLYPSVTVEVGGVRYGPSPIVKRSYEPRWDYEFPRPVKWKQGDAVHVLVTDNYYWKRPVAEFRSPEGEPLAMRFLTGEIDLGRGRLVFSSDFPLPAIAALED